MTNPTKYERRITELEKLNATLVAQIDRMRPVVEAAVSAVDQDRTMPLSVIDAVYDYKAAKAQQA